MPVVTIASWVGGRSKGCFFCCCLYVSNLQQIRNISKIGSTWYCKLVISVWQMYRNTILDLQWQQIKYLLQLQYTLENSHGTPIFFYLYRCVSFSNTGIFRFQLIFVFDKTNCTLENKYGTHLKRKHLSNRHFLSSMFIFEVVLFSFSHAKCWWRLRKLSDWQLAMVLFQSIQEVELAPSIVSDLELKLTKMFMGI